MKSNITTTNRRVTIIISSKENLYFDIDKDAMFRKIKRQRAFFHEILQMGYRSRGEKKHLKKHAETLLAYICDHKLTSKTKTQLLNDPYP